MASSSSSAHSRRMSYNVGGHGLRDKCYCGDLVGTWRSWTPRNPGRKFLGCPNFMDDDVNCEYFHWIDPPLTSKCYKDLILQLRALANGGVVDHAPAPVDHPAPVPAPLNAVNPPVPAPIPAPVPAPVPAPLNAVNPPVGHSEDGFWKWLVICVVCIFIGKMLG